MCEVYGCRFLGRGPYGAAAVANALLAALPRGWAAPGRDARRVHDLVWLADGWSLAIDERRLVDEDPRPVALGDCGPRYASLEAATAAGRLRDGRFVAGWLCRPERAALTPDELDLVAHVARRYGGMGADELAATHFRPGTPFMAGLLGDGAYDEAATRAHFVALAMAGRAATASRAA